jgi:DNA-binding NarL/FixJ family response regulator
MNTEISRTTTGALRVFLVEDSAALIERLSDAIREVGEIELVGTASTEASAVAALESGDMDVVVLDLHLKQGTGFGVLRSFASARRKPTVIVLTNYDLPEYKKAALNLGADYFLDKALDYGRLPEVLSEILQLRPGLH